MCHALLHALVHALRHAWLHVAVWSPGPLAQALARSSLRYNAPPLGLNPLVQSLGALCSKHEPCVDFQIEIRLCMHQALNIGLIKSNTKLMITIGAKG